MLKRFINMHQLICVTAYFDDIARFDQTAVTPISEREQCTLATPILFSNIFSYFL